MIFITLLHTEGRSQWQEQHWNNEVNWCMLHRDGCVSRAISYN